MGQIYYPSPGTVKSVAFVGDGTVLSSTPSTPVTTSGNIVATLLAQSPNLVLAGPATGASPVDPTFRALVVADIPSLPASIITSGTISTARLPVVNAAIQFVIDGGGSTPGTGSYGQISIPYNCTIVGWTLTADQSGSAVIDVLRSTFSAFPTTSSIAGTDKPTLSSAQKANDFTLSGWGSTALNAGDELQISLSSVTSATRLNLTVQVTVP